MPSPSTVLLVDDDATFRRILSAELDRLGYPVIASPDGKGALAALRKESVDVALVDMRLDGEDGIDLLQALHAEDAELPVLMLTGHGSIEKAVVAMQRGAHDFLTKPCPLEELERALHKALSLRKLTNENARLRRLLPGGAALLGSSTTMAHLREQIERVAPSKSAVLIQGESGTGKELVARAVHEASERRTMPFVPLNCAGLPESLFESELFGHERGAFTGAEKRKIGLFEVADGGTLFLDEIGELHPAGQAKLLRVLQSGEIRRVAGSSTFQVDVRVLAATNRDLIELVREGTFREDLYYRLAILELRVPPLRERPEDIELLLRAFLARRGREHTEIEPAALKVLMAHRWPGNVRELESVAERIVLLADGEFCTAEVVARCLIPGVPAPGEPVVPLERVEKAHILNALRVTGGDKRTAAGALGISLRTLYNRLKDYEQA